MEDLICLECEVQFDDCYLVDRLYCPECGSNRIEFLEDFDE